MLNPVGAVLTFLSSPLLDVAWMVKAVLQSTLAVAWVLPLAERLAAAKLLARLRPQPPRIVPLTGMVTESASAGIAIEPAPSAKLQIRARKPPMSGTPPGFTTVPIGLMTTNGYHVALDTQDPGTTMKESCPATRQNSGGALSIQLSVITLIRIEM